MLDPFTQANSRKKKKKKRNTKCGDNYSTCGDDGNGDLSVHRGIYQSSEYTIRIRVYGLVDNLRRCVDLSKL